LTDQVSMISKVFQCTRLQSVEWDPIKPNIEPSGSISESPSMQGYELSPVKDYGSRVKLKF